MANRNGDLDAYAVHFSDPERWLGPQLTGLWNCLSQRMRAMLPGACATLASKLEAAGVRERLYTCAAREVTSDDLLVCNTGVSAAYVSPPHFDRRDVGWTFAFAVKCDHHAATEAEQNRGRAYRSNSDGDGPPTAADSGGPHEEQDQGQREDQHEEPQHEHSDSSTSAGEAPTVGERLPWEHEEAAQPEDDRDAQAVLRSNTALAWQRVWREMYPQHGGQELLALFLRSPSEYEKQPNKYGWIHYGDGYIEGSRMLSTDEPSGSYNRHMVRGLRHFAAHRDQELMARFLPGVAHFEEVDDLAFAIKADLDTWSGQRGRGILADNRMANHARYGLCGSLFLAFHGPSRVGGSGSHPRAQRAVGPPWHYGPLEVAPHLARSTVLHSYVKSLLFFGEDELDCLCSFPGPPNRKNLLLVTRLLLEQRHLCPLLAEWLWETMRVIMVEDDHSPLGRLPGVLKRKVAQDWLAISVPARLHAQGAWQGLLSGRAGREHREHRGAWQTLWERSYAFGGMRAWPGAGDHLLRPPTSGRRRKVLRPGQVLRWALGRLVLGGSRRARVLTV